MYSYTTIVYSEFNYSMVIFQTWWNLYLAECKLLCA